MTCSKRLFLTITMLATCNVFALCQVVTRDPQQVAAKCPVVVVGEPVDRELWVVRGDKLRGNQGKYDLANVGRGTLGRAYLVHVREVLKGRSVPRELYVYFAGIGLDSEQMKLLPGRIQLLCLGEPALRKEVRPQIIDPSVGQETARAVPATAMRSLCTQENSVTPLDSLSDERLVSLRRALGGKKRSPN